MIILDDSKDAQDDSPDADPVVRGTSTFARTGGELFGKGAVLRMRRSRDEMERDGRVRIGGERGLVEKSMGTATYLDVVVDERDDDVFVPFRVA